MSECHGCLTSNTTRTASLNMGKTSRSPSCSMRRAWQIQYLANFFDTAGRRARTPFTWSGGQPCEGMAGLNLTHVTKIEYVCSIILSLIQVCLWTFFFKFIFCEQIFVLPVTVLEVKSGQENCNPCILNPNSTQPIKWCPSIFPPNKSPPHDFQWDVTSCVYL